MIDIRIIIGIGIVVLFLLYFVSRKPCIVSSNNNTYDLHVYPWGTQVVIKDILTTGWTGDVDGTDFKWERKPQNYSGFYQLDTGSHLLTDLLMMKRKEVLKVLDKHGIKHENLIESGYAYLQGGTPPINIYQDIRVDNKKINHVPVGLMALNDQGNMLKEREIVNGVAGLSHIKGGSLKPYSFLDKLLENVSRKTLFIDFKNEKMITGLDSSPDNNHFKGKIDSDGDTMRMDVWVTDNRGNSYPMLVDTGTLYSQFKYTGEVKLNGISDKKSSGTLIMKNAKMLPPRLVGNGKPVILGYNDLYKGSMFIDYDNYMLYINQNY